ncbi:putative transporter C5D6.04 [Grifola frondosa]|uniref:Putative transporter C5D6.04 n=1 Tax=Grifola frondosa TaxID=5627 RepID=A0A1C7LSB3_GRIFR|nr:putative transporter C5D6.04 [Grifola frondosa]
MLDAPIVPLLKVVFESILEVFLLCIAGYFLARRGVLDKVTQKKLNRLNVSIFTPALLFSKVAFFLSPAKLRELWIIPIFFVVTTVVSMIVAYLISLLFRLQRSQRSFAVASSMFMNSNSLPIALMQSLVVTVPGLKWGDDDSENAMVGRALTYLVLYSTLGMVVRWSYGVRLLSQADPEHTGHVEDGRSGPLLERDETAFPPSPEEQRILRHESSTLSVRSAGSSGSDDSKTVAHGRENPGIVVEEVDGVDPGKSFYTISNPTSHAAISGSSTEFEDNFDDDDGDEIPQRREVPEPTSSQWESRMRRLKHRFIVFWHTVREFMTVPLWAALASLVVACVQPLQHALDEHLPPVKGALASAGNCSIPVTLVVLGAYFYTPPDPEEERERAQGRLPRRRSASTMSRLSLFENVKDVFGMKRRGRAVGKKPDMRPGETRTVVVAVLSRMIVTPLLLLPLLALSTRFDLQEVFDDPVFVVSNVLLITSPPALTLAQITQAASGDAFERLISRTIFWSYCVVTPPSTILFVVIGLVLSKL